MTTLRATALLCIGILLQSLTGCYNSFRVPSDEFRKLQSAQAVAEDGKLEGKITGEERTKLVARAENESVFVKSEKEETVRVARETKLFVRSEGGRRYQVTPFNFSMVSSQLVASDRDYLLPLNEIQSFEIDHMSTGKTIFLTSLGVIGGVAAIVVIIATAGVKSTN